MARSGLSKVSPPNGSNLPSHLSWATSNMVTIHVRSWHCTKSILFTGNLPTFVNAAVHSFVAMDSISMSTVLDAVTCESRNTLVTSITPFIAHNTRAQCPLICPISVNHDVLDSVAELYGLPVFAPCPSYPGVAGKPRLCSRMRAHPRSTLGSEYRQSGPR